MYIKKLSLTNFGITENYSTDLVDGMIVVRGRNGSGKSTRFTQGILYTLFGSTTLEATFEDTVTEGKKPSALKSELQYGPYTVKRSKSSASVTGNDISITGQEAVSEFFRELFGIQKATENLILVAEQGNMAGVFKKKKGEVTRFIESIAGFDQIDELIEKVKLKYPSGNKAILESQVEEREINLTELSEVELPDLEAAAKVKTDAEKKVTGAETDITINSKNITLFEETINTVTAKNDKTTAAELVIKTGEADLITKKLKLEDIQKKEYRKFDEKEIKKAEELSQDYPGQVDLWNSYVWFSNIVKLPTIWHGIEDEFEAELSMSKDRLERILGRKIEVQTEIKQNKKKTVSETECSQCGQDISKIHKDLNEKLAKELNDLTAELISIDSIDIPAAREEFGILVGIDELHKEQVKESKNKSNVSVTKDTVPFTYTWADEDKPVKPDPDFLKAATKLISDKAVEDALINKDKEITAELLDEIKSDVEELDKLHTSFMDLPEIEDITETISAKTLLEEDVEPLAKVLKNCNIRVQEYSATLAAYKVTVKNHKENVEKEKSALDKLKVSLVEDAENGKILKSVRDAKPKVLDQVWGKLLYVVSTTYSTMVGEESVIEKSDKGFNINGRSFSRLSGSEKSVAGIALRVALKEVFAEGCGFLILDEPGADMDEERTLAMISAVKTIPGQTIMITHEELSGQSADQIIEVT